MYSEYNEQASKSKDHDGLAATRMRYETSEPLKTFAHNRNPPRHRRDADPDDPTRTLGESHCFVDSPLFYTTLLYGNIIFDALTEQCDLLSAIGHLP
jgi:hypothetical protein